MKWPETRGYFVLGSVMLSVPTRRMRQVQVKGHVILDFEFGFTKLLLKDGVDFPDLLPVVRVQFLVQIPATRDTCVVVPLWVTCRSVSLTPHTYTKVTTTSTHYPVLKLRHFTHS